MFIKFDKHNTHDTTKNKAAKNKPDEGAKTDFGRLLTEKKSELGKTGPKNCGASKTSVKNSGANAGKTKGKDGAIRILH
jgi:hypothetical protein